MCLKTGRFLHGIRPQLSLHVDVAGSHTLPLKAGEHGHLHLTQQMEQGIVVLSGHGTILGGHTRTNGTVSLKCICFSPSRPHAIQPTRNCGHIMRVAYLCTSLRVRMH